MTPRYTYRWVPERRGYVIRDADGSEVATFPTLLQCEEYVLERDGGQS